MNTALLSALHEIETDKGIPFETVKGVLEESLLAAYQGREGAEEEARVVLDEDTGDLRVMKDGEDITPHDFTRIAAQVMRQTFYQRLNEVHNEQLLEEYGERMGDVVTGIVQQAHRRMTLVDLGRVEAILPASEQVPNERYENGQRLKVYLLEIREGGRGPSLTVSRRHEGLLKNLFELEVPEIYDGLVEIRAVAREAGLRSKVAVWSKEAGVDPVGACVGPRGSRVRAVAPSTRTAHWVSSGPRTWTVPDVAVPIGVRARRSEPPASWTALAAGLSVARAIAAPGNSSHKRVTGSIGTSIC